MKNFKLYLGVIAFTAITVSCENDSISDTDGNHNATKNNKKEYILTPEDEANLITNGTAEFLVNGKIHKGGSELMNYVNSLKGNSFGINSSANQPANFVPSETMSSTYTTTQYIDAKPADFMNLSGIGWGSDGSKNINNAVMDNITNNLYSTAGTDRKPYALIHTKAGYVREGINHSAIDALNNDGYKSSILINPLRWKHVISNVQWQDASPWESNSKYYTKYIPTGKAIPLNNTTGIAALPSNITQSDLVTTTATTETVATRAVSASHEFTVSISVGFASPVGPQASATLGYGYTSTVEHSTSVGLGSQLTQSIPYPNAYVPTYSTCQFQAFEVQVHRHYSYDVKSTLMGDIGIRRRTGVGSHENFWHKDGAKHMLVSSKRDGISQNLKLTDIVHTYTVGYQCRKNSSKVLSTAVNTPSGYSFTWF